MNNLEWLYENDKDTLVSLLFPCESKFCLPCDGEEYRGGCRLESTPYCEIKDLDMDNFVEWLMAEHESCNQDPDQAEEGNAMTDNRTTELLPCPFCGGGHIHCQWNCMSDGFKYREIHCNSCSATLTNYSGYIDDDIELIEAWNSRATHGTLTAEQVSEAVERHVKFYEGGDYDEQAIADELNAELGGGECEGSKERLQKMLGEMKKLASDGRREWCGRSHGEYGIFASLEDFAKLTEQRMDELWMWGSRI